GALSRRPRRPRLGRIAIERSGIVERRADRGLLAFRADEGVDQRAQPVERRLACILEDAAQKLAGLSPLVALQAEQDRRLVRKILIQRSDPAAGLSGHPRGREALRAFLRQTLNSGLEDGRDQPRRAGLLRLFSRGNTGTSTSSHGAAWQCE